MSRTDAKPRKRVARVKTKDMKSPSTMPCLEDVDKNPPDYTLAVQMGAGQGESYASRMIASLSELTLDDDTLFGAESGKRVRLQEVKKTELALRLLRGELPATLRRVYAETDEFLACIDETLAVAQQFRSSGALPERMQKGHGTVVRKSLTMIDKRLGRVGISDKDSKGMYAATETRCNELNDRAKAGQFCGEENARLASRMGLYEQRWGILYAVALIGFIVAVFRLFLFDILYQHIDGTTFTFSSQMMEIAGSIGVIVASIYLVWHGFHADRERAQCVEVESKSRRWTKDLRHMQKFAKVPKDCFMNGAGIVDGMKRNLQGVLDVLDTNKLDTGDDAHAELVESQLLVFCDAVDEQEQKLKQLQEDLQTANLEREKLQQDFTTYDFSKL